VTRAGAGFDGKEEKLFLDTLVLPEDSNTIPEVQMSLSVAGYKSHQVQMQKPVYKTLLARLDSYNEIKTAIEKLRNGEEIGDVPEEI
jgi:GrpB-like predicted nucleotidyltransferase (UPF0157 family)